MSADRAALAACRCAIRLGIKALPVEPLAILRKCRNTRVMSVEQAAEALELPESELMRVLDATDAWTYRQSLPNGELGYMVVYRDDGHPGRRRFSLAHELGHIVLHHDGRTSSEEQEADAFASHLLCPQPVLDRWQAQYGTLYVEDVAQTCFVSVTCAQMLRCRQRPCLPNNIKEEMDVLFDDAVLMSSRVSPGQRKHEL